MNALILVLGLPDCEIKKIGTDTGGVLELVAKRPT